MRILVVDDHEFVRRGICNLLASNPMLTVCGEAVDGRDAIETARVLRPDLVIMDISMPNTNGLEATREIKRLLPETKFVIVSQHDSSEMVRQAFSAGASGYVVKSSLSKNLLAAITAVNNRQAFVDGGVELANTNHNLDAREILQRSAAFETALRESDELFRSAMNNMAEGLYTIDTEGLVTYVNPSAEAMFGWTSAELLGKRMHEVTHYNHPDGTPFPAADCPGLQVLQKGAELCDHEDVFIRRNGSFFPVVFSASPLKINGGVRGIVVCFRDDTRRREAEAALRHDVAAMSILQKFSTRLGKDLDLRELVEMSLDAAIALTAAQRGNVQLLDAKTGVLRLFAQRGFESPFLDFFSDVRGNHAAACAAALQAGKRVEVEDVLTSMVFTGTPAQQVMLDAKARAVQSTPLLARSGKLVGMLSTHFEAPHRLSPKENQLLDVLARQTADFIERCETESALRRTTAHFQLVTDTMAVATTRCSRDLRYMWINPRYAKWMGLRAEDIIGHPIVEILGEEAFEKLRPYFERVLEGEPVSYEEEINLRNRRRWILAAYVPTFDSAGTADGWVASIVDITKRKEIERALRESEERFRAIVETTPECVKLVKADGTLLHMNSSGLTMVGANCTEMVVGKNVYDLIASYDRDRFRAFNERICGGERGSLEFDIVGLQGVDRHMETQGAPLRMSDGSVVQLAVTRDISERARVEQQLRRSEERLRTLADGLEAQVHIRTLELEQRNAEVLQQSEQLRDLSNRLLQTQEDERRHIARELHDSAGQIVTAIGLTLANVVQQEGQNPILDEAMRRAQELVRQLSREIRTTSYLLHPPLLDENGLAGAIGWYIDGMKDRSGLNIELSIPEDFGRLPGDVELVMFRMVQECLTNIHRHSGSNTATIRLWRNGENVSLEIQDDGKGIRPETLAKIQSHCSGVGITGMRERVRHFGGAMDIQSNGRGTKIAVTLPAAVTANSERKDVLQQSRTAG